MLKKFTFIFMMILMIIIYTLCVTANVPYRSYTYNYWQEAVSAPHAYLPAKIINSQVLGVANINNLSDIFIRNDNIYLLDAGNNKIYILAHDWKMIKIINELNYNDTVDKLLNPQGLYVTNKGEIYVADTGNARILIIDIQGEVIKEIRAPERTVEGIVPQDFVFAPIRIGVSPAGRIFVIGRHVYEGIMVFGSEGEFQGFVGAPRVRVNPLDYFWSRIATEAQRERSTLILPTEYSSIDLDDQGFIYTTVISGVIVNTQAIRRLNPSGEDILRREGFIPPIGDYGVQPLSRLVDITARDYGMYSVLDRERGRIFTYDIDGNLLYVFGGKGRSIGNFVNPRVLISVGEDIAVLDGDRGTITIFKPTKYAQYIHKAIMYYNEGHYEDSSKMWEKVLKRNTNFDLAYRGIGRTYLIMGNYEKAMDYFKLGQYREQYSQAYNSFRRNVINNNFSLFFYSFLLFIAIIIFIVRINIFSKIKIKIEKIQKNILKVSNKEINKKNKIVLCFKSYIIKTVDGLLYATYIIFHPFTGFWELKTEKREKGSVAWILLSLVILTYVFMQQYEGFIFNTRELTNIYLEIISILFPFFLWCSVNWALTTLMDGKGSFFEIIVASAFALTPLILINIPATLLSNFITLQEGSIYYFIISLAIFWSGSLLFISLMVIHEYSITKTLLMTIFIILGILITLFIGLMLFSLFDYIISFVQNIYVEIIYR